MGVALNGHLTKGAYLNGNKVNGYLNGIKLWPVTENSEWVFAWGLSNEVVSGLCIQETNSVFLLRKLNTNIFLSETGWLGNTKGIIQNLLGNWTFDGGSSIEDFYISRLNTDYIQILKKSGSCELNIIKVMDHGVPIPATSWTQIYIPELVSNSGVFIQQGNFVGALNKENNNITAIYKNIQTNSAIENTIVMWNVDSGYLGIEGVVSFEPATYNSDRSIVPIRGMTVNNSNLQKTLCLLRTYETAWSSSGLGASSDALTTSVIRDFASSYSCTDIYRNRIYKVFPADTSQSIMTFGIDSSLFGNDLGKLYTEPFLYNKTANNNSTDKVLLLTRKNDQSHIIYDINAATIKRTIPTVENAIEFFSNLNFPISRSYLMIDTDKMLYSIVMGWTSNGAFQLWRCPLNINANDL